MEKLADNIAKKISLELKLDSDRKEVIAYGTFALLHTLLSIILVIIFGAVLNVMVEALIISFAISILRKYSGGVHASSPGICASVGTVITLILAVFICFGLNSYISLNLIFASGLICFFWSYYIIIKLAPVDSPAKPIKTQKKRERMKKGSIFILAVYAVIVLLNIYLYMYTKEKRFLIFSLCIYSGTVWQAFTLTTQGHTALKKLDSFLNQLITLLRRGKKS
ncbi:accessory gene regulator B family protein [Clostridium sp. SYSU_GA19001]|uniref:accessory gene regulator ArgB-like protein n=1 Tax=Clostridium caldaquaticum TaxID=2940653 RepID=UPI0020770CAD|nr:accessory gene regulator B family protein [Clostridium caldaquaticum]MCM8710257.1 accessory gene regulator B family protein [Clostridium caldaquaticum]